MKKKSIAILCIAALATLMVGGIAGYYLFENAPEASIAVLSDTHIISESYFTSESIYQNYSNRDKMVHLSEAIAKSIVDEIIRSKKIKTVLIPGDLTEAGDLASHLAAARIFQKLADAGKQVFVINGNHDSPDRDFGERIPSGRFREIYYNFGYKQALVTDEASLSYTADINKKYRLIAIDNDNYNSSDTLSYKEELDDRLINWCEEQIIACKATGKTPIIMAHKPFLNHFPGFVSGLVGGGGTEGGESFDKIVDMFIRNGVNFTLTGHNHIQSIKNIKKDENVFYDIGTCSAIYYPSAYRTLRFTKKDIFFDVVYTKKLNMSYVHPLTSSEEYAKIKSDFPGYVKEHCEKGFTFLNSLRGSYLINLLNLSGVVAEVIGLLADEALLPLLTMPIYKKDANGGQSLEKMVQELNIDIPPSNYTSIKQVVAFFIMNVNKGGQEISMDSVEIKLLNQAIYGLFYKIDELKEQIAIIAADAPNLDLDILRLYQSNELELFDSQFLAFVVALAAPFLPIEINVSNLNNLKSLKLLIKPLLNMAIPNLGDAVAEAMGNKELNIKILLEDAVYGVLLAEFFQIEENNRVVFNRETWQMLPY